MDFKSSAWMAVSCTPPRLSAGRVLSWWPPYLPHVPGSPAWDAGPCHHALLRTSSRHFSSETRPLPLLAGRNHSICSRNTSWCHSVCQCGVILCLLICLLSSVGASANSFSFTLCLRHHARCLADAGTLWTPVLCPAKLMTLNVSLNDINVALGLLAGTAIDRSNHRAQRYFL